MQQAALKMKSNLPQDECRIIILLLHYPYLSRKVTDRQIGLEAKCVQEAQSLTLKMITIWQQSVLLWSPSTNLSKYVLPKGQRKSCFKRSFVASILVVNVGCGHSCTGFYFSLQLWLSTVQCNLVYGHGFFIQHHFEILVYKSYFLHNVDEQLTYYFFLF